MRYTILKQSAKQGFPSKKIASKGGFPNHGKANAAAIEKARELGIELMMPYYLLIN